jgi:hypothetical protein
MPYSGQNEKYWTPERVTQNSESEHIFLATKGLSMKKELEKKLYDKYPDILRREDRESDPYKRGSLMGFGLACGDGWYNLMDALLRRLSGIYHNYGILVRPQQVKEKFAGLRFYYDAVPDMSVLTQHLSVGRWLRYQLVRPICWLVCKLPAKLWGRKAYLRYRISDYVSKLKRSCYRYTLQKRYCHEDKVWKDARYNVAINIASVYEQISGSVGMAETMSYYTCESCGNPGKRNSRRPWVVTICDQCEAVRLIEEKKAEEMAEAKREREKLDKMEADACGPGAFVSRADAAEIEQDMARQVAQAIGKACVTGRDITKNEEGDTTHGCTDNRTEKHG